MENIIKNALYEDKIRKQTLKDVLDKMEEFGGWIWLEDWIKEEIKKLGDV